MAPVKRSAPFKPTFTQAFDRTKSKTHPMILNLAKARQQRKTNVKKTIGNTISQLMKNGLRNDQSVCCKPTNWNQGGYDAFFVEFAKKNTINLRFCQITKAESHTLKGGFFETVIEFLRKAGYTVKSVEIAFILTRHNADSFSVKDKDIDGFKNLKDYSVFGAFRTKWGATQSTICRNVALYKLDLTE